MKKPCQFFFESDLKIKFINSSGHNHFDLLEVILVKIISLTSFESMPSSDSMSDISVSDTNLVVRIT